MLNHVPSSDENDPKRKRKREREGGGVMFTLLYSFPRKWLSGIIQIGTYKRNVIKRVHVLFFLELYVLGRLVPVQS